MRPVPVCAVLLLLSSTLGSVASAAPGTWVRDTPRLASGAHLQLRVELSPRCDVHPSTLHEHLLTRLIEATVSTRVHNTPPRLQTRHQYVLVKVRCYPAATTGPDWHRVSARVGHHDGQSSAIQPLPSQRYGRDSARRLLADASAVVRQALREVDPR